MFSNIFQPYIYSKTKDITWVRCTFNFHTNVRRSNSSCFTDCTKVASTAALMHRQQTLYWLVTQTASTEINLLSLIHTCIGPWWIVKRCSQFRRNSNLQYFFLTFQSRDPRKSVARGGKLWSPETLLYPNISNQFFFCTKEKLLIFYICEI